MRIEYSHSLNPSGNSGRRTGSVAVESAVAYSVFFLILFGLLVGSIGVFKYQAVAHIAREAARYASVRGQQYALEVTGATAATPQDIYDEVIAPKAEVHNLENISYTVTWDQHNEPYTMYADGTIERNTVTVTISYDWSPTIFFGGTITLSSSSTMPMSF